MPAEQPKPTLFAIRRYPGGPSLCVTADEALAHRAADRCAGVVVPVPHLIDADQIEDIMPGLVIACLTIEQDGTVTDSAGMYVAQPPSHLANPLPPVEAALHTYRWRRDEITEITEISASLTAGGWGNADASARVREAAIVVAARMLAGLSLDEALHDADIPIGRDDRQA